MDKTPSCELMLNMVQKASSKTRGRAESCFRSTCNCHSRQRPTKQSGIRSTSSPATSHSLNGLPLHQLSTTIITGGSVALHKFGMRWVFPLGGGGGDIWNMLSDERF